MEASPCIDHAVAQLAPGGRIVAARELTGGVSARVDGVTIETGSGSELRVVVRQHVGLEVKAQPAGVTAREFAVLAALHRRGFAVPEPLVVHGGTDDTPAYLAMEWVDGIADVGDGELPSALEQMADFLARLHTVPPGDVTRSALEELVLTPEIVMTHLPRSPVAAQLGAGFDAGLQPPPPNPAALVHGDYWPGNVLWRDGLLKAVIDWEDTCLADPLADLAGARVELLCRYGADAMATFTSRYLALRGDELDLGPLALWEVFVAGAALASMHRWGLAPDDEAARRSATERFFEGAADEVAAAWLRR